MALRFHLALGQRGRSESGELWATFVLPQDDVWLGRDEGCDLRVPGGERAGLGRRHTRFTREGDRIRVCPSGTTNGTFIDGERIAAVIAPGDTSLGASLESSAERVIDANGKYVIVKVLGEGGMGNVYLAEHSQIGRKVAIKALHPQLVKNEAIRARFKNEASTMAHLQHPNIVALYDYCEEADGLYLVMEYVEGQDLAKLLQAKARDARTVLVEGGLKPRDVRAALSELSAVSIAQLAEAGIRYDAAGTNYCKPDAAGRMTTVIADNILVVTAGGYGAGWSTVIPCWSWALTQHPVTRPVRVPGRATFERDLAKSELDFA